MWVRGKHQTRMLLLARHAALRAASSIPFASASTVKAMIFGPGQRSVMYGSKCTRSTLACETSVTSR